MSHSSPERFLSAAVRERIEQAYYARVNEQARLENLLRDPFFLENAARHPAFYSDHGVVHVRDVAGQVLRVLQTINGVLIPARTPQQMESFLYGYGVALAYLHDIGMSDLSPFGRRMHPEFAAQAVFAGPLDGVVETMWEDNCGNIAWHLTQLAKAGALHRDVQIIFRELLAMCVCHSKSKVSAAVLDDPAALRARMQAVISRSLEQQAGSPAPDAAPDNGAPPAWLGRFYTNFEREAFDWLTDASEGALRLIRDVTDTLRALRCADAFRQRGTVEKTSGGYEIFASQKTGACVIALRLGSDRLYLMELPDNLDGAGEANIASSEFNPGGDLRISFHRGAFDSPEAQSRSVSSTSYVIGDLLRDTVESFRRAVPIPGVKTPEDILILLESTDDDPRFVELVRAQLCLSNPQAGGRVRIVPSLRNVAESERARYLAASELDWDEERRQSVLEKIRAAGQRLGNFDPADGFAHVRFAELQPGERLIEAGEPSAFVYIPLGDGLRIIPLGGYQSFSVAAWMPLGTTGVIRGDIRNADVVAERGVPVLIIPKEIYLRCWYAPYSPGELKELLAAPDGNAA